MADMARRRLSGAATSQDSRKRKYDDREDEGNTEDGSTDFPCHFCSSVFVTQMSLDRHVLTFHDGEVEVKQEIYIESEEVEDQDDMYETYDNSDIKEEEEENEDESGLLENEDDYFYTSQDKSETEEFFDSSALKPQVTMSTSPGNGFHFPTVSTNSPSTRSHKNSQPDRVLKPKLSSEDLSTVLAQVEEMTANSTSEFVACPLCHKTFGRKELSIHIACEHGGAKFSCPYCGRNISRRDHLKRHIKNVHPEMCTETEIGPFPRNLNLCRASNAQKKLNTSPNNEFQQKLEYAPQVLPISVVTPRVTVDDEDDEEDDFEGEEDELLQQDTSSRNSQESHDSMQITVEPDLPFHDFNDIDYSEEDYATPSFLMDVLQLQQDQKPNLSTTTTTGHSSNGFGTDFTCTLCSAAFSSKVLLDRHESTHEELRPHKCSICAKGFLRKEHLSKHLSSVHSGMKFTCEFCGKDISRKDHLIRHIRNVHPTQFYSLPQEMEQEMMVADIQSPQQLPVSLKTVQSMQPKPKKPFFSCDMCEATFVNVDDLHAHQGTVHSDVRKYKCNYCCKAFKRKEHLTKHEVLHTGERKFGCRICGNEFLRKDALQEHIRRTHGVDGNSNSSLIATKPIAASLPPPTIPCNLCDQKFRDRGMLLSHMTTVHGLIVNSPPALPRPRPIQQQQRIATTNSKAVNNILRTPNPKPAGSISSNSLGSLMDLINKGSITLSFHPVKNEKN